MDAVAEWLSHRVEAATFASSVAARLVEELEPRGYLVDGQHSVAFRVKSTVATQAKLRSKRGTQPINDFIGIRVLSRTLSRLPLTTTIATNILQRAGLVEKRRTDMIDRPAAAGYRAIHIDYILGDGQTWSLPAGITVELQLTTWLLHFHGALSHCLYYKAERRQDGDGITKVLAQISQLAYELDKIADAAEAPQTRP